MENMSGMTKFWCTIEFYIHNHFKPDTSNLSYILKNARFKMFIVTYFLPIFFLVHFTWGDLN